MEETKQKNMKVLWKILACNPRSTAALPRIIPVEPPIVNINKKRSPKNAELVLSKIS